MSTRDAASRAPFLGLHYFDEEDEPLFFGRDEQTRDVLAKLSKQRFVAVLGSSGSGKSSLVRAGVIPALRAGFLAREGGAWRVLKCHPGNDPIGMLARQAESVLGVSEARVTLRRGPLGLVELCTQAAIGESENVLVLVDQFEEIFRYQREAPDRAQAAEEAAAFVKLLLEACAQEQVRIYVLITMRSEYLGTSAQFRDLPERINAGLYLVPRMRRDQLEEAIAGPIAVAGARLSPALVQRLLNDTGEDPDQLPVLQHALLRTWGHWKQNRTEEIGFEHYEATGGVRDGLNRHAEEIFERFSDSERRIAEVMFRCLSERDPSYNTIRRPTRLDVIAAISGATWQEVAQVADLFRADDVAFIVPRTLVPLAAETELDITHESLIRKWNRLGGGRDFKGWIHDEAELRDQYREYVRGARKGGFLSDTDVPAAVEWRGKRLREEWALRYVADRDAFTQVLEYIARSEEKLRKEEGQRSRYSQMRFALVLAIVVLGSVFAAYMELMKSRDEANEQRKLANARMLASRADGLRNNDSQMELRTLLAAESIRQSALEEGVQALREPLSLLVRPRWSVQVPRPLGPVPFDNDTASLRFSPDGKNVAVASPWGTLHILSVADGSASNIPDAPDAVASIAWTDKGLYTLRAQTVGDKTVGQLSVRRAGNDKPLELLSDAGCDGACFIAPDAKYVAESGDAASALRAPEGKRTEALPWPVRALGPNGRLALANVMKKGNEVAVLINRGSGNRELRVEFDAVRGAFDIESRSGFVAFQEGSKIRIYQTAPAFEETGQFQIESATSVRVSPSGNLLAIGDQGGGVRVVDWRAKRKVAVWAHRGSVAAIAFSPDERMVSTLDKSGGVRFVELPKRNTIEVHLDEIFSANFEDTGRYLVVRSSSSYEVVDTATGKRAKATLGSPEDVSVLSPDFRHALVVKANGDTLVASLEQGTAKPLSRPPGSARPLALAPGARYAAFKIGNGLSVVDVESGSPVTLPEKARGRAAAVFSPDGRFLALRGMSNSPSGPATSTVLLLRCGSWDVVGEWPAFVRGTALTFSPKGEFLAIRPSIGTGLQVIETAHGAEVRLAGLIEKAPTVRSLRFSPDGRYVAIYITDQKGSLRIYELVSRKVHGIIQLEAAPTAVVFSSNSALLAVSNRTTAPRVFQLPDGTETTSAMLVEKDAVRAITFADGDKALNVVTQPEGRPDQFILTRHPLLASELFEQACRLVARNLTRGRKGEWQTYLPGLPYVETCPNAPNPPQ